MIEENVHRNLRVTFDLKTICSQLILPQVMIVLLTLALIGEIYSGLRTIFTLDNSMKKQDLTTKIVLATEKNTASAAGLTTHFFGAYVPIDVTTADVKATMLDLKIVGIMYSTKDSASQIIIQTAGGAQKTYNIGDTVAEGVVIRKITSEGALLAHHGSLESLSLPKPALSFEPPPKPLDF